MLSLEPFIMLGSAVFGGVLKLIGMKIAAESDRNRQQLDLIAAQAGMQKEARDVGNGNKPFEFTRRTVTLLVTASVVVLPLLAQMIFNIPVTYGWTEWKEGFWPFTDGKDMLKWHTVQGFVITPMHTQLMAAIAGLYFGAMTVGKSI